MTSRAMRFLDAPPSRWSLLLPAIAAGGLELERLGERLREGRLDRRRQHADGDPSRTEASPSTGRRRAAACPSPATSSSATRPAACSRRSERTAPEPSPARAAPRAPCRPATGATSVTPARQNWRGHESAQSTAVTVNAPALTLSPTNVTSLPAGAHGVDHELRTGQTVTFRLDNQTTGQVLTGSITPSTVPANGTAAVSVTLPNGVPNGSHTIYAIGSGTDVASTSVTVAVPTTITTQRVRLATTLRAAPSSFATSRTRSQAMASPRRPPNWATAFAADALRRVPR